MLRKLLDSIEKTILSNDKLKKFHPLHDALDTFYILQMPKLRMLLMLEIQLI